MKRSAERELVNPKDGGGDDSDSNGEPVSQMGGWRPATEEVMATRKIIKAKRPSQYSATNEPSTSGAAMPSLGLNFPPLSSAPKTYLPPLGKFSTVPIAPAAGSQAAALNKAFISWVEAQLQLYPMMPMADGVQQYIKFFSGLKSNNSDVKSTSLPAIKPIVAPATSGNPFMSVAPFSNPLLIGSDSPPQAPTMAFPSLTKNIISKSNTSDEPEKRLRTSNENNVAPLQRPNLLSGGLKIGADGIPTFSFGAAPIQPVNKKPAANFTGFDTSLLSKHALKKTAIQAETSSTDSDDEEYVEEEDSEEEDESYDEDENEDSGNEDGVVNEDEEDEEDEEGDDDNDDDEMGEEQEEEGEEGESDDNNEEEEEEGEGDEEEDDQVDEESYEEGDEEGDVEGEDEYGENDSGEEEGEDQGEDEDEEEYEDESESSEERGYGGMRKIRGPPEIIDLADSDSEEEDEDDMVGSGDSS